MSDATGPEWFRKALEAPHTQHIVEVEGCPIHYLRWGQADKPGLVLVHGGAAHAHWWSFLAPMLASQYSVVALDLSGHGDSGQREAYPRELFAREVMAVAEAAAFVGPPVLVGHSMGGLVSIVAASLYGSALDGAVIIDAPVRKPDPESGAARRGRIFRHPKTYPDLEAARAHFFLVPPQPCENTFLLDHLARTSLTQTPQGWTWKYDPRVFHNIAPETMGQYLANVRCRVALFRGEHSVVVPPETHAYMQTLLDHNAPVVEIPEAHHHLILDQPLAFIAALRAILADWEHSIPKHPATNAR